MSHSQQQPQPQGAGAGDQAMETDPPQPAGPDFSYRNLWPKLDLGPQVTTIIQTNSRAFVNNLESFMAADPTIQEAPLSNKAKERKRRLSQKVYKKLEGVKKERKGLQAKRGKMPAKANPRASIKQRAKKNEVTIGQVQEKGWEVYMGEGDANAAYPYGKMQGAFNLNPGGVEILSPDVKIGEQTRQYLGHISEVFFAKVKGMEVECMLVNNRLLLSANEAAQVNPMAGFTLHDLLVEAAKALNADIADTGKRAHARRQFEIGVMGEALKVIPNDAVLNEAQKAGAERLAAAAAGYHVDYGSRKDLEELLRVVQHQVRNAASVQGPYSIDAAATKITDATFQNAVIAVNPLDGGKSHAEQHLALAYIKSGYTGKAVVAGTKIPCATCWLSLALVHQAGYAIEFNNTPGGHWDTSVFRGLAEIARVLGVTDITNLWQRFVDTGTMIQGGRKQYLTALWENTGLTIKIPREGGGLAAKGLTQDISRLTQYPLDVDNDDLGTPFDTPGTPKAGGWETPEDDPDRQSAEKAQSALDTWELQRKLRDVQRQQAKEAQQGKTATTTGTPQDQGASGAMDLDPNVS
jgi:hypothetical protein